MRSLILVCTLLLPVALLAQPATDSRQIHADLTKALVGDWTGVLEYRDYSEPATSTKRVQLPTWMSVTPSASGVIRRFIYDDGPTKTVQETDTLTFDIAATTFTQTDSGKPSQVQHVSGYDSLKAGRGDLVLTGTGTDNGKPTETRTTLTVDRNLVSWVLEVRPAGSAEPFSFRHRFTFTRANSPVISNH